MTDRKILHPDSFRAIPISKIEFADGYTITVVNDTMVNVNELAERIWNQKTDVIVLKKVRRNYINAVKRKSLKAHDDGVLPRLPPMATDIFVELESLSFWLDKWCHRDSKAKDMLAGFDMDGFKKILSHVKVKALEKLVKDKLASIERIEEDIRIYQEQIDELKTESTY